MWVNIRYSVLYWGRVSLENLANLLPLRCIRRFSRYVRVVNSIHQHIPGLFASSHAPPDAPQLSTNKIRAWMCQEVSKWVIPHLEVGYNPFTNHLLTSWDIQVGRRLDG